MQLSIRFLVTLLALLFCTQLVAAVSAVRRQNGDHIETQAESRIVSSRATVLFPSSYISGPDSTQTSSTTLISSISSSQVTETPSGSTTSQVPSTTGIDHPSTPTNTAEKVLENPLPIHPTLTPAMGLSGAILLVSGLAYAIIGIRNRWVYVFGSAAYLTALAVTVLIIYLMSPPVSNAVQGAFFVASFVTGVIFGALSLVFSDITDGFGCLLGGFCLSMWFLTLKDGNLIPSTTGRAILIGCMSAGSYSLYFSHYTRGYSLIVSIAFSGATAAILGIDCLACSGLKEFWLYTWNLNDNLFPLNTNTYPVTKNIKAEQAGVVIIAVFGIVSQMRVWRLVQEHRASNAAQQLKKQQDQDREEEALGRKIEGEFHKERAQWEASYGGNKEQASSTRSSTVGPQDSTRIREIELSRNDSVEMITLPHRGGEQTAEVESMPSATITVNVLNDDNVQQVDPSGNAINGVTTHGALETPHSSVGSPLPPPVIVPLPFAVPIEGEIGSRDDNTSISAVPDSEHDSDRNCRPMSKRVSDISAMKLRLSRDATYSQEALINHADTDGDQASSIAVTLDDDDYVNSLHQISLPHSPLHDGHRTCLYHITTAVHDAEIKRCRMSDKSLPGPPGEAERTGEPSLEIFDNMGASQKSARQSLNHSTSPVLDELPAEGFAQRESRVQADTSVPGATEEVAQLESEQAQSKTAEQVERAESHIGSLRDGTLPPILSKVAQSYRTNEWAKHLDAAEKPNLEHLEMPGSPGVALVVEYAEQPPAPVSEEIASALHESKRGSRRTSRESAVQGSSRRDLNQTVSTFSQNLVMDQRGWKKSAPALPLDSSNPVDVLTPLPSSTLMGRRETLLRKRVSSQSLTPKSSAATLLVEPKERMTLAQRREGLQQQNRSSSVPYPSSVTSQGRGPPSAGSQKKQNKGWAVKGAPPGFDSHAPTRNSSSHSSQKREQLYAGWRETMREGVPRESAGLVVEQQRQVLLAERRQKEFERQQREAQQQQRASQMTSMMRSGQMLDAHREAMRKMQADANRAW